MKGVALLGVAKLPTHPTSFFSIISFKPDNSESNLSEHVCVCVCVGTLFVCVLVFVHCVCVTEKQEKPLVV